MDTAAMLQKPDEHVQMRWKPNVKARYSFLYNHCLDAKEKESISNFN